MKIALYIEDGVEQIVLTPETATERSILGKLVDGKREMKIYRGGFYACRGGWTRWKQSYGYAPFSPRETDDDESTIIVLNEPAETAPPPAADTEFPEVE